MQNLQGVYGVVIVSDLSRARAFYTTVFNREPDRVPMPSLCEWHVGNSGVQVLSAGALDAASTNRAGHSYLTIFVTDLDGLRRHLESRNFPIGPKQSGDVAGIAQLTDPDGNTITFAQRNSGQ